MRRWIRHFDASVVVEMNVRHRTERETYGALEPRAPRIKVANKLMRICYFAHR
jgi:hypothetical protein